MKRSLYFSLILGTGVVLGSFFVRPFERAFEEVPAHAAGGRGQGAGAIVVSGNGDVNGDNGLDLSDAIYLLAHLFQGGPAPEVCPGGGGNCPGCQADLETCEADLLACRNATPEDCPPFGVGVDEDLDCLTDCDDPDCFTETDCTVVTPTFTQDPMDPDQYTHDQTGIVFVLLPGGTFDMGSPDTEPNHIFDEGPVHAVTLDPFLIAKTEVTQAQYEAVTGQIPSNFPGDGQRPVERVSWFDLTEAGGFLQKTGLQLPTEAQWEYAARGGTSTAYSFGGDCNAPNCDACATADDFMWWCGNAASTTHPVGDKDPNPFGLHDMHGNVWEWCEDVYDAGFYEKPEAAGPNPVSDAGSTKRVFRGGSWHDIHNAARCRSANRSGPLEGGLPPTTRGSDVGFRPVAVAPSP